MSTVFDLYLNFLNQNRYISTELDLWVDCAQLMFRLRLIYFSGVPDLFFHSAQPIFRPMFQAVFFLRKNYVSTVLRLCFDLVFSMFQLCSTHVSTVLDLSFD